jgi:ribose-phosphate pyrophosphokinase
MKIEKIKYPDGSFYTKVDFEGKVEDDLTFRINSYEDLWQLRQIKDVCDHSKVKVNLTIPNLFDAQADRRFNENEPNSLKLVCNFINDMKFESVSIFHPHNQEVIEALIDNEYIIDNSGFIGKTFYKLHEQYNEDYIVEDNLILMSTDAGGFKPLMKLCDKIGWKGETYSASKSRKLVEGKSKLTQQVDRQDFGGKDILIIDDICVYGGTFVGLAKMLKERNCGKLYLAISHITVEKPNPEIFDLFEKVFTTNSKNFDYVKQIKDYEVVPENLEIINLF